MNAVFADTSYYLALLNENDELHAVAVAATAEIPSRVFTTIWILVEVADAMCRPRHRGLATDLIRELRTDRRVVIAPQSSELFDLAFNLYVQRPDKDWSLTDCLSFVVMEQHGIRDALTADRHFEQAGFSILMR